MRDRVRVGPEPAPAAERRRAPVDRSPAPAGSAAIRALQRTAGNRAVAQLMRAPGDGEQAPLLLTDRPWAEIEREQRDRMWGGILPGTQQPRTPGRSLPEPDMERLLTDLRTPLEEAPQEPADDAPSGPPLLLTDRSWKQLMHEDRAAKARKAREQRSAERQAQIAAQKSKPRKAGPRSPHDAEATARRSADAAHESAVEARERTLAGEALAVARAHVAGVEAVVAALVPHVQPPNPVAASFMNAAEINQVAADLLQVQTQLTAIHAHDAALAAHVAALAAPSVAQATLAAAYTDARTRFDVAALSAQVQATRRAHLTAPAIRSKVKAMTDAAIADPARQLGAEAARRVEQAHAGKTRATIAADIAAAVQTQHHPKIKHWLELLQVTKPAKNGQLRIKNLRGISSAPHPVHLSVYIDQVQAPVAGVGATLAEVLDAVLPPNGPWGAHVTLEYAGAIKPHANPHYFRGDAAGIRNDYPSGSWAKVEADLKDLMAKEIQELSGRIQLFLDRKGRPPGQ